ncbi:hypothetical protein BOX15_Mlig034464g2, partial [Macrostomum lignano]
PMAADNSTKIPTLLSQVLECIKSSKGDALVTGLKEVNQFFSTVNEYAFRQMGAQMAQASSEDTSATAAEKPETTAPDAKSQSQQQSSSDSSSKQPVAKQAEQSSSTAQGTPASKDAANGVSKSGDSSVEELGLPKPRDGHVAVCSTSIMIKQIPKFWSEKKVKERAEEFGTVTRIDYKAFLNTAAVTFKSRSEAFKAISGVPKTRPLSVSWELNSGIANSYFKKYWDANDGATFIPISMFPWMKQKDLLLGGALLLGKGQQPAASNAANADASSSATAGSKAAQSGSAAAPSSASKASPANKNAPVSKSASTTPTQRNVAGSPAGSFSGNKASGNVQNSKRSTSSSFGSGSNQKSVGPSARGSARHGNRSQGDIPSLFASDFTKPTQPQSSTPAQSAGPRFATPSNPPQQSMPQAGQQQKHVRPYGSTPSIGIAGSAQQLSNPFASPASRAPAPGFSNIGQQHSTFPRQSRNVPDVQLQQQQQQNAAFGKRNSLDSNSAHGGEIKRPRMDEPMQPVGRGYVPGRNASFESGSADRSDMSRGPEYSQQTGRSAPGPQFGQPYANPAPAGPGIRPFGTPRPVSNQGLLQPPANSRFGQSAPPPRPFRF